MRLALFFTFEMSLERWEKSGILERELALYRRLVKYGIEVELLTYGTRNDLGYQEKLGTGIRVNTLFSGGPCHPWLRFFASWLAPWRLRKLLMEMDIVKTNQFWGCWAGMFAKLVLGKPWVHRNGFEHHRFLVLQGACFRDRLFSLLFGWLCYRIADAVVWSNPGERDWSIERFHLHSDDSRFIVIPNYVDTESFYPVKQSGSSRRILAIGRLEHQKNHRLLIRALEGSDYELEIIGEGPLKKELERTAAALSVKLSLPGRLPHNELPRRMHQAEIFVMCSNLEGLPKALLEAMACGMVVVGTDIPGIRGIIVHEQNGMLVDPNPASLRNVLERIHRDQYLRERLGEAAVRTIHEGYNLDRVVELELALYHRLVKTRG